MNVVVTSGGQAIPFMTTSTSVDGVTSLSFATNNVLNAGIYSVDVTYSLSSYPSISKVVSFDLTLYVLKNPVALS